MGGFLTCPKCNNHMFFCIEYVNGLPIPHHKCYECGYDNKNEYKPFDTLSNCTIKPKSLNF